MQPILVALSDSGDADHVLAAVEQTRVDEDRAGSFGSSVDHQSIHVTEALATDSEHRCAEFDLHAAPSRIVVRNAAASFDGCSRALARLWHVGGLVAYGVRSRGAEWQETTQRG